MPRTTRSIVLVPLVAAALFGAAGCASLIPGTPSSTGSGGAAAPGGGSAPASTTDDPVVWVDQVCGALIPFVEAATTEPPLDSNNPTELVTGLSTFFGTVGEAAGTAAQGVQAAGPSPVEGGDELVTNLTTTLTSIQTSFQGAKTAIDSSGGDPTALTEALAPLEQLSTQDPTADLLNNAELNAAAEQAANCNQLKSLTG